MKRYHRVVPRDFFNEAKLLKCMGRIALRILDNDMPSGLFISMDEHDDGPFDIVQNDDGEIFVYNYPCTVNDRPVLFATKLNSRDAWPMVCYVDDEVLSVFRSDGQFDDEFLTYFGAEPENTKEPDFSTQIKELLEENERLKNILQKLRMDMLKSGITYDNADIFSEIQKVLGDKLKIEK